MKKFMFSCLMTWSVAFSLSAATIDLEKKWAPVIRAIAQVESEGNPKMVSKCGRYVGYLQISKILVRECNQILGKQVYTYDDRYDKQKSIDMFIVFQEHFNKEGNTLVLTITPKAEDKKSRLLTEQKEQVLILIILMIYKVLCQKKRRVR